MLIALVFTATFAHDAYSEERTSTIDDLGPVALNYHYYGDSLLAIYHEIPSYERFKVLKDSLHRYYMTHPDEPIEHREFYEDFFEKGDDLLKVARMEWDLLLKESISLTTGDSVFDSVYEANHSQIMDSLNRLPDQDRRIIQYALLVHEFREKDYASVEKMHVGMEIQALLDTIFRENPGFEINETNMPRVYQRRHSRKEHNSLLYLGFGIPYMHLFGQDSSNSAETLANSLWIGTVTDGNKVPDLKITGLSSGTIYDVNVADIQSNVTVEGNEFKGTLKYLSGSNPITNVWGEGNFLAFDMSDNTYTGYTSVKVGLVPSAGSGLVEIKNDDTHTGIAKIENKNVQKFRIVATDGTNTETQDFDLNELTVEGE